MGFRCIRRHLNDLPGLGSWTGSLHTILGNCQLVPNTASLTRSPFLELHLLAPQSTSTCHLLFGIQHTSAGLWYHYQPFFQSHSSLFPGNQVCFHEATRKAGLLPGDIHIKEIVAIEYTFCWYFLGVNNIKREQLGSLSSQLYTPSQNHASRSNISFKLASQV